MGTRDRGRPGRGHAPARHDEADPPADPGRVRPAQGARERRRRRHRRHRRGRDDHAQNLPAVLRLVAEVLREPAFAAKEFEQLQAGAPGRARAAAQRARHASARSPTGAHIEPYPKGDVRATSQTLEESLGATQGRHARATRASSTRTSTAPRTASSPSSATSTPRPRRGAGWRSSSATGRAAQPFARVPRPSTSDARPSTRRSRRRTRPTPSSSRA